MATYDPNTPEAAPSRKLTLFEYIENNPVAAVIQALAIGFAVGMIVRLLEGSHEKEPEIDVKHKPTLDEAKFHLGSLLLPFLWPVWQNARKSYGKSAETVRDAAEKVKKSRLPEEAKERLKEVEEWAEREAGFLSKLGKKKLKEVEDWLAEYLAKGGQKKVKDLEAWLSERLSKGGKQAKDVEEWLSQRLAKSGKQAKDDVEEWVEKEVLPAAECGWKKLRKFFR